MLILTKGFFVTAEKSSNVLGNVIQNDLSQFWRYNLFPTYSGNEWHFICTCIAYMGLNGSHAYDYMTLLDAIFIYTFIGVKLLTFYMSCLLLKSQRCEGTSSKVIWVNSDDITVGQSSVFFSMQCKWVTLCRYGVHGLERRFLLHTNFHTQGWWGQTAKKISFFVLLTGHQRCGGTAFKVIWLDSKEELDVW